MSELETIASVKHVTESKDEILTAMGEQGLTIMEAIKASMQRFGIGLGEAKSLVTSHPAWKQTADASRPFQDELIKALKDLGE